MVGNTVRSVPSRESHCAKVASYWLIIINLVTNRWIKGDHSGQKFLISQFCPSRPRELWHSITRSSRSTCRTKTEPQGEVDEGERGLARGTEPPNGQRSSVRGSPSTKDVKCQPSNGDLSDTGQRRMRLRRPRGAGEFRLTGHSGFSAFYTLKETLGFGRLDQFRSVILH